MQMLLLGVVNPAVSIMLKSTAIVYRGSFKQCSDEPKSYLEQKLV